MKDNGSEAINLSELWIPGNEVYHAEFPKSIKLHFHYQMISKIIVEDSSGKLLLIKYILAKDVDRDNIGIIKFNLEKENHKPLDNPCLKVVEVFTTTLKQNFYVMLSAAVPNHKLTVYKLDDIVIEVDLVKEKK